MSEWKIALTPRQRATYDALWRLTSGGKHGWTGVLPVDGLLLEQADAAVRSLKEAGVIDWTLVKRARRYVIKIAPDRLAQRSAVCRDYSKLKSAPAVGRDWPSVGSGAPRSFAPTDDAASGIRWDDGRFTCAFTKAFPTRDYSGIRQLSTYSQPVENKAVSRSDEYAASMNHRHNLAVASIMKGSVND